MKCLLCLDEPFVTKNLLEQLDKIFKTVRAIFWVFIGLAILITALLLAGNEMARNLLDFLLLQCTHYNDTLNEVPGL